MDWTNGVDAGVLYQVVLESLGVLGTAATDISSEYLSVHMATLIPHLQNIKSDQGRLGLQCGVGDNEVELAVRLLRDCARGFFECGCLCGVSFQDGDVASSDLCVHSGLGNGLVSDEAEHSVGRVGRELADKLKLSGKILVSYMILMVQVERNAHRGHERLPRLRRKAK